MKSGLVHLGTKDMFVHARIVLPPIAVILRLAKNPYSRHFFLIFYTAIPFFHNKSQKYRQFFPNFDVISTDSPSNNSDKYYFFPYFEPWEVIPLRYYTVFCLESTKSPF